MRFRKYGSDDGFAGMQLQKMLRTFNPKARFFVLLLPRVAAGICTPTRLAAYAISLADAGHGKLAAWCWIRAIEGSIRQPGTHHQILEMCIAAGQFDAGAAYAQAFYEANGLEQGEAVRLISILALHARYDAAAALYQRLLDHNEEGPFARCPSPMSGEEVGAQRIHALLTKLAAERSLAEPRAELNLWLARLCFAFGELKVSALLFGHAQRGSSINTTDRIAHCYSVLSTHKANPHDLFDQCLQLEGVDSDWRILYASVLFACGNRRKVQEIVGDILTERLPSDADVPRILSDCRAVTRRLYEIPEVVHFGDTAAGVSASDGGVRKIFVCGSGWSGSGALYDALSEFDGLAHAPDTPLDRYMNEGTDNEMMFVQGPWGLGQLWRRAKEEGRLTRMDFWHCFRLHVLGSGPIGYSEHKSARVASNLLSEFGSRYTRAFRDASDALAMFPDQATLAQLHRVLTDLTESLGEMFVEASPPSSDGGMCSAVVFNNAIFASNIDMLEIFRNAKAGVVFRDPLDQFSDRRAKDIKHWMRPNHFAHLYQWGRKAFDARRSRLVGGQADGVMEISFEKFVLDPVYREQILAGFLAPLSSRRVCHRFDPQSSAQNIDIQSNLLSLEEREQLSRALARWRP